MLLKKNRLRGKPAPGGYRDGNFVFELCWTECLCECQILIQEFADVKEEAHESYEVRAEHRFALALSLSRACLARTLSLSTSLHAARMPLRRFGARIR